MFQSSLELSPECNVEIPQEGPVIVIVSILTRAFARVQPPIRSKTTQLHKFQSSLELSPECNGFILVCVLDGVQEGVCANPTKKGSNVGWHWARQMPSCAT